MPEDILVLGPSVCGRGPSGSCARIHEYVLGHHPTPHWGRILSHGCHNVLIENSRKVSNCWWLWALSVWKLFRACKDASINKHLNSYAFSVPMKAILAGCGGHTFNPSRPAKAGESLWDQPGLYCEFCPGQPFTPHPHHFSIVFVLFWFCVNVQIFLLSLRSENFIQWPALSMYSRTSEMTFQRPICKTF